MTKTFWITDNRFKFITLILILIWLGFMIFFYLKADEITKDPCGVCAERMGSNVFCTLGGIVPLQRVYYSNGSIVNKLFGEG